MNEFLGKVAEVLEVDSVVPEFEFRTVDDWDSMKGFALIVMMQRDYGKELTVAQFMDCHTVADLARAVGIA